MTMILDKLAHEGLVCRSGDESDRRITRISLTPAGERVLNLALKNIRDNVKKKMSHLEKKDIELFSASLSNIVKIGSKIE
jgi:DNA-binding MarR family transcriptional regulator